MANVLNRRDLLLGAAAACAATAVPQVSFGAAAAGLAATDLGAGLLLIEGAGANVVAAHDGDSVLLVDGGSADRSADLLDLIAQRSAGAKIDVLFNTNWREIRTGSNAALAGKGAKVMAHENTKLWLGGDFFVEWENRHYQPQSAATLPTATFYKSGTLDHGGRKVDYWYLPRASTDGDVVVFLPAANVLVAGDVLAVGRYPLLDYATGGWIGGLQDATKALLERTDRATRLVPAVGPVVGRAALEAQLALCTDVRSQLAEAFRHGLSMTAFAATKPTRAYDAERGDPQQFLALAYKGAFGHLRELGGVI